MSETNFVSELSVNPIDQAPNKGSYDPCIDIVIDGIKRIYGLGTNRALVDYLKFFGDATDRNPNETVDFLASGINFSDQRRKSAGESRLLIDPCTTD